MSAVLCGKRSYFDESPTSPSPVSKKLRCCSPFQPPSLLHQLHSLFPHMETPILERALVECGYDLDSAIKSLHKLNLGYAEVDSPSAAELHPDLEKGTTPDGTAASVKDPLAQQDNLPLNGAEWVELFVREMGSAASVDDARSRATRVLESLEKSITQRVGVETAQNFQKEIILLKEQVQVFLRENNILKRAVAIQHERQKEFDERNQEVQHLKRLVSQYQEQLRTLEVNNYALSMHLKQSMENNSMPGSSNRDVF